MSRTKLIKKLKEKNPKLNQSELEKIIDIFSNDIVQALKDEKSVEIRGLGRLYLKYLKENFNARNPATNELICKPDRVKVRFKPAKGLNKKINK